MFSSATGATCLGVTLPLMKSTCVKSCVPSLRVTVTDLWNAPGRPDALYVTVICASPCGAIGSRLHAGVVQPQDARTFLSVIGPLVMFLSVKTCDTRPSSSLITPKSCVFSAISTTCGCCYCGCC